MATFRKRTNGRWQAIIRRTDLHASRSFERFVDAKSWARAIERDADLAGTLPGKMAGTLKAVIDRYEKEMWPVKKWGASKAHELVVLERDLGPRLLADLTQATLINYVRGLTISPSGIAARLSYLREVLKTARDLWSVRVPLDEVNAAIAVARRQKLAGRSLVRTRRPTEKELAAILAHAEQRQGATIDLAPIVRILSVLPLRIGELLGIKWADLDEKRRTVALRGRKHPDSRVKEASVDVVPLIEFGGIDTFVAIWDRPRYLPSPFPYKAPSVTAAFAMAALRCQIVDLHLHDLRAHALSSLLEAGVPIPQVALISGHRNWKVLSKHYARIDPASVHDTVRRLG
jgi:integrase